MPTLMKTTVTIDSASGMVTISRGSWTGTFPVSDLQMWIDFYRGQQDRFPEHAASYADDVRALEAANEEKRGTAGAFARN